MGSEFFQRTKKTINAARDRDRELLGIETLFTRHPECARYAGRVRLRDGMTVNKGEDILVEMREGKLIATRGLDVVGDFIQPPAGMTDAVGCVGGLMRGNVDIVMDMTRSAEVVLCP